MEAEMKSREIKKRKTDSENYIADLRSIVSTARKMSFRAANLMQVACNWLLGWRIVEQEQQGKARADYGKRIIEEASASLTENFGNGFSETQLRNFRKFYCLFKFLQIQQALLAESSMIEQPLLPQLSWSHYESLMRVPDLDARQWYMQEAAAEQWDYRTLKRNIASQYYYRLMQTPKAKRAHVVKEMKSLTADYQKDAALTESTLESTILNHL